MSETLDLSLLKGTSQQREEVSNALLHTLKTKGCAKLKNHGLPAELISEMFDQVSSQDSTIERAFQVLTYPT